MAAILPGATDITEFWGNVLSGKNCIIDIPDDYWTMDDFFDPNPDAQDKTYGYKAGVVESIEFDSIGFGIPPAVMESISVEQLYALVVAKTALLDAGLIGEDAKAFNKDKTGVVLAAVTGKNAYSLSYRQNMVRTRKILINSGVSEELADRVIARLKDTELEWTEDSEPGYLGNVTAGRIANRFDLGGMNCVVDAACASGLAALKIAVGELQNGDSDVMLAGGVNLDLTASAFISFCKTPALSKENVSRPFDAGADGMILGDGVAMVVLKRLEDAERAGDRIYAVIKSVGSSADGRCTSIFAPSMEGQIKAIERAYDMAGVDMTQTTLIEAHGTGTFAGDGCELTALNQLYSNYDVKPRSIVIGSVKSQIGHTRLAAGIAGLMKAALSLYHRTLPPTINVTKERAELEGSPFRTISSPKPWITSQHAPVRRASLSSFGFGGANYHAVLEEYAPGSHPRLNRVPEGVCLSAADNQELAVQCRTWIDRLTSDPTSYDCLLDEQSDGAAIPVDHPRLGFVGMDGPDVLMKLRYVVDKISGGSQTFSVNGDTVYLRSAGIPTGTKVVTLFPGQSAQYEAMMSEIAMDYPEMSDFLAVVGNAMEQRGLTPISEVLYFGDNSELTNTVNSQSALAAICGGLYSVMAHRGYSDDMVIGHSFGEIAGLWAAGAIDTPTFADMTVERGMAMASGTPGTGMLVVADDAEACQEWIKTYDHVYIANENSADQTMLSGDMVELKALAAELMDAHVPCSILNVSHAFHSPYMKHPNSLFQHVLDNVELAPLTKSLYSVADGRPYDNHEPSIRQTLFTQIERPVRFMQSVVDAHESGARVFVEVGPGKVLTNLVRRILGDQDVFTIAVNGDRDGRSSQVQLEEALVQLRTLGFPISGDAYRIRASDIPQAEKPKSAYTVGPVVYMTPSKKEIVEQAINTVDTVVDQDRKGKQAMDTNALDVVYGIQSLNGQALEKFLASQEQQISVFSQLMQDSGGESTDVLRLMEAFQANSMRAYDTYMEGQREILGGQGSGDIAEIEPTGMPAYKQLPVPVQQPKLPVEKIKLPDPRPVHNKAPVVRQAAVQPSVPPGPSVPQESPVPTREDILVNAVDFDPVAMMISIISDKTGYPEDMVDADMNIESDLGIDSIKRIEIFAELSNRLPNKLEVDDVEALAMLHTISEMGDYIKKAGSTKSVEPSDHVIKRFEVGVREAETTKRDDALMDAGIVVIIQDEDGVAECLADKMKTRGYETRLVDLPEADEAAVERLFTCALEEANQPLAGFVHVAPNSDSKSPGSLPGAVSLTQIDMLKSVFLCAKYFTRSFVGTGANGFFVSAVRMDGHLGLSYGDRVVQGGLFGLHKSLNVEWHNLPLNSHTIISEAIDVAPDVPPDQAADYVMEEIFTYASQWGVGRTSDGRRFETCLTERYPDPDSREDRLGADDVLLVTGGGRGITAQCAIRLAQTAQCGFIFTGRTDISADYAWAKGERDRARLRGLAIEKLNQKRPRPATIEALVDSALHQMEINDTLDAIRAAGGRAHYVSCDVRDASRLKAIIAEEEARLGPVTGLVHGAGNIADKTIQRKTADDFDMVVGPKVYGLEACLESLDLAGLKYLVMFSSTSAYFGNGGQTDYSMANEVMNKFAFSFKRSHPGCTTMAIDWGLWDGGSMASDSIRNAVKDSEIVLIPVEVGTEYFVEQFTYAQQPDVCQIVINCSPQMLRPSMDVGE